MYILIAIMLFYPAATSSVVAEFNTKEACQAAAAEMQKNYAPHKIFCAAKGEKK